MLTTALHLAYLAHPSSKDLGLPSMLSASCLPQAPQAASFHKELLSQGLHHRYFRSSSTDSALVAF